MRVAADYFLVMYFSMESSTTPAHTVHEAEHIVHEATHTVREA